MFHALRGIGMLCCLLAGLWVAGCKNVNPYYDASRAHHRPEGFTNSDGQAEGGKPLSDVLSWYVQRARDGLPKPPSQFVDGYAGFPVLAPDTHFLSANRSRVTATWIGHATVLLQIGGLNVITDPQFSERAFMVQWLGPKRKVALPLRIDQLPHIDLVVISHNHYDHLDLASVQALNQQPGGAPMFAVPLGVEKWLRENGIERVKAYDWWDSQKLGDLSIDFVPVHHWSTRTLFDRNQTLWGGWVIRAPGYSMFFAGDTGYSKDFADIGAKFGPVDLALIPVGAYEPRWFMAPQHVNPAESVKIHQDVRAKLSIGIHWGTFELTDEPLDQPIGDLASALKDANLPADRFVLLKHGETRILTP